MTFQDLLNSEMDFKSLGALSRQGLTWWLDELSSMLPSVWRARLSSKPRVLAEQVAGGVWRYWKDGRPAGRGEAGAEATLGLLLPPAATLIREVRVARMPAADVRRMLTLDIDRLSPLNPNLIHFDIEIVERDAGDGLQTVLVGVATRASVDAALAAARAEGLTPVALGARAGGETPAMHFDFLPAALAAAGETPGGRARRYWWAAVAGLLLINIVVIVARDIIDVERLGNQADAQTPIVNTVLALQRRVGGEERRRMEMIARGRKAEPLRIIDALTQAIPSSAWVQRLEWNGQTLRIVGFKKPETDIAAALRGSGAFTNIRVLGSEAAAGQIILSPFDITADARPPPAAAMARP